MKTKWVHLKPREHIYYFSPSVAQRFLSESGLSVVRCQSLGRTRNLKAMIEALRPVNSFVYKIAKFLIPDNLAKRLSFSINLYDEIAVFASKD